MVAENSPGPGSGRPRFEVHLNDLAGGVAAHHDVEEHRLLQRQRNLEERVVIDERHVDAASIISVGMDDLIATGSGKHRVHGLDQPLDHEHVLHLTHPQQIGAPPTVHRGDH